DRGDVIAENAAIQARYVEAGPEVRIAMPAAESNPTQPVAEAATLSERAATLVEHDILTGHLAPGARLGIVDLVQRYDIGATPLRDGLPRLVLRRRRRG